MRAMKAPGERGPIGAWAQQAREDSGLSVEQVIERLAAKGSKVIPSTVRGWEGGSKRPGRRQVRLLAEIYGVAAPGEPEPESLSLVAALNRQAAALEALAAAIDRDRDGRAVWEKGLLESIRELAGPKATPSGGPGPRTLEGAQQ